MLLDILHNIVHKDDASNYKGSFAGKCLCKNSKFQQEEKKTHERKPEIKPGIFFRDN